MTADSVERNYNFKQVNLGPKLVDLPAEVVSDISTDQSQFYQLVKAVRSGLMPGLPGESLCCGKDSEDEGWAECGEDPA